MVKTEKKCIVRFYHLYRLKNVIKSTIKLLSISVSFVKVEIVTNQLKRIIIGVINTN